mmetsp:Transcript_9455/g.17241  ORF Transcript_9455/g.17241 Transcript_9455/m.17241 type:complete len:89 (+) Transcript_9455:124-390(+)
MCTSRLAGSLCSSVRPAGAALRAPFAAGSCFISGDSSGAPCPVHMHMNRVKSGAKTGMRGIISAQHGGGSSETTTTTITTTTTTTTTT